MLNHEIGGCGSSLTVLIRNAAQIVTGVKNDRRYGQASLQVIENGAIAIAGDRIVWVGSDARLSEVCPDKNDAQTLDASGCVVCPGFIDCHTHTVFGGTREEEFELRIRGASYLEIAARGGGIASTVRATRSANEFELFTTGFERLNRAAALGCTTLELKSGYGLSHAAEIRLLRIFRDLQSKHPLDIISTYLGPHAIPYDSTREDYINEICRDTLPQIAKEELAAFCDVFCEQGAFTVHESEIIIAHAHELGLKVKIHADQITRMGGARLAAQIGAVSADHLDMINDEDIAMLYKAEVVPVLIPGTNFFLGLKNYPPARALCDAGLPVALGSNFNPGSCMTQNLFLIMTIASTQMGMTPSECFLAVTQHAAQALCLGDRGVICPGSLADLVCLSCQDFRFPIYHFGDSHVRWTMKSGVLIYPV